MKKFLIAPAIILSAVLIMEATTPKVIAHRGHFNAEGSAQNSIRALIKADSIGADYSEFDVWMTADSVLVVNHDATFRGVDMEHSPASIVTAQKLDNGENLPTLGDYLSAAKNLNIKLICEIKVHDSLKHEQECIRRTVEMIKNFGLEDRTEYVTFSKNGILTLVKICPKGTSIQYPKGDYLPEQLHFMGITGMDYKITVLKKHPEWIKRAHDLGLAVGIWTINTPEEMQWCIDNSIDYITCNDPETLIKMLKDNQ